MDNRDQNSQNGQKKPSRARSGARKAGSALAQGGKKALNTAVNQGIVTGGTALANVIAPGAGTAVAPVLKVAVKNKKASIAVLIAILLLPFLFIFVIIILIIAIIGGLEDKDLKVDKSASVTTAHVGDKIEYTIHVTSPNNSL